MKKLYSFLAAALLAGFVASADVTLPYECVSFDTALGTAVENDAWTTHVTKGAAWSAPNAAGNLNFGDNKSAFTSAANASAGETDSWLISPQFACKENTSYTITFNIKKQTSATSLEHLDIYLTQYSPIAGASSVIQWYDGYYKSVDMSAVTTTFTEQSITISTEPGESGNFLFAFRSHGTFSGASIAIAGVTIKEEGGSEPGPDEPIEGGEHECKDQSVPYSSTISVGDGVFDQGWSVIDVNGYTTWGAKQSIPSTGSKNSTKALYAQYTYAGSQPGDDYLVSPAIHMEAGKEYKVMFDYETYDLSSYSAGEEIEVCWATEATAEAFQANDTLLYHKGAVRPAETKMISFNPTTTDDYYFAVHCISPSNRYYIYISDFQVVENVFAPKGVTDLTAVAAAEHELKATVSWTLPTQSVFGDPFTEEQTIEKVEIYRDGGETPIATLAGDATSFEDTAATGLTSGKHYYSVVVTVAGAKSAMVNSAETRYVGPIAPMPVPQSWTSFTQEDFDDLWSHFHGEESEVTLSNHGWTFGSNKNFRCGSTAAEDEWLITPPLAFSEAGYYRVTVNARVDNVNNGQNLQFYIGTEPTAEAMTLRVDGLKLVYAAADYVFDFKVPAAGTYYIGARAYDKVDTQVQWYYINAMSIEASEFVPGKVKDLTATPDAEGALNFTIAWTAPTTSFAGDAMGTDEFKTEVYINSELYTTLDGDAEPTLFVEVEEAGVYTVKVVTVSLDGKSAPEQPEVSTGWVGDKTVTLPYSVSFANASTDSTILFWESVDGNKDGKTWICSGGIYTLEGSTYNDYGLHEYSDYLLSPEFEAEAGNIKVDLNLRGGSYSYAFPYNVGVVKVGEFDADKNNWASYKSEPKFQQTSYVNRSYELSIPEAGKYRVVIAADEMMTNNFTNSSYRLSVKTFAVKQLLPVPEIATEVTVTPDPSYGLEATISWVNPTMTSFEGVMLDAGDITEARVYRNGTLIGTVTENLIPGVESSYVDSDIEKSGTYTYKVEIYGVNGCSETPATEVKSTWIGPGTTIPNTSMGLDYGLNSSDCFETWSMINKYGNSWIVSWNYGLTITSTSSVPDAYAVSRPIQFEENNLYSVEICSRYADYSPSYFVSPELYHGASDDVTEYTKIGSWDLAATANTNNTAQLDTFYIYAVNPNELMPLDLEGEENEEGEGEDDDTKLFGSAVKVAAGPAHIALHAKDRGSMYVRWVTLRYVKSATGVEDVFVAEGVIFAEGRLRFEGTAAVEVYDLTGKLVAAEARAEGSFDMSNLANGIYVVRVTPEGGKTVTMKVAK